MKINIMLKVNEDDTDMIEMWATEPKYLATIFHSDLLGFDSSAMLEDHPDGLKSTLIIPL